MTRIEFRELKLKGEKVSKCNCGKRIVRRKTFSQTLNPFNKKSDGTVKDVIDIQRELIKERLEWYDVRELCGVCSENSNS